MKWLALICVMISGFSLAYAFSGRFLDWMQFQSIGTRDYIARRLTQMFIEIPPEKILMMQLGSCAGLALITFIGIAPNWGAAFFASIIVAAITWKAPKPVVDYMYEKRLENFVGQMVDGLGLMSNGMKSGLSVVQALDLAARQMPNPMKQEFELILNENKLGISIEESFVNLSKRLMSDEVEMFVTSINILKETGGNLAETFDTITYMIRERIKAENKIKAMTRIAFLQGMVVLAAPPMMGVMFYVQDPEVMAPMFSSVIGLALLGVVLILEIAGFFLIQKFIKIEV